MALTYVNLTAEPRAWSIGPIKQQVVQITALSTDTSGVVTFDSLAQVRAVIVNGVSQSAAATLSGNGATLALNAQATDYVTTVIGLGI
jgi:hypothetical protein